MKLRWLGIGLALLMCGLCSRASLGAQEFSAGLVADNTSKSAASGMSDEERAEQQKKNKEKKNKRNIQSADSLKSDKDGRIDFIDSSTGYWNARVVSDPAFGSSGESVNSVMFQSRPGRNIRNVDFGKGKQSDIEINGGKPTEVFINGKKVNSPKELEPDGKLEQKP